MARGSGKDPREAFAIERLRFRERGTDPEAAPPQHHCELFFKDHLLYKICEDGKVERVSGPTDAFSISFLSEPERANGFTSTNVQEAIEEAITGTPPIAPTTTTNATPTLAFSFTLADNTAYIFDAKVVAFRVGGGDYGAFQEKVCVRRAGGGAVIVGDVFQNLAQRTDLGMDVNWNVSGNDVQLLVTGVAAKTIHWQPQIESEQVA